MVHVKRVAIYADGCANHRQPLSLGLKDVSRRQHRVGATPRQVDSFMP
jgi:hypothetical protein